uniref:Uncharacterized protein n=1 Tax=Strongyloides venezuelensis TaxID=75913 RepID=A0A0K0FDQ5_STRVS
MQFGALFLLLTGTFNFQIFLARAGNCLFPIWLNNYYFVVLLLYPVYFIFRSYIFIVASFFLSKDAILTFIHVTQFRILLFMNGYFLRSAVFILLWLVSYLGLQ